MSKEEELNEAVLMVLRRCFDVDGSHVRFDLGFEEKHTPPQSWNNLFIRARQGHKDNDANEQGLIKFLDFRGNSR